MAVSKAEHAATYALDDLYRAHASDVYRYALAVLGNPADAEDITQTTFLNAYRSLASGVRPRKPSSWLLTIASNLIKQRFRSERARPATAPLDERLADAESDEASPTIGELLTALGKIPPLQRQAIVLREFEGRPYREIAEILDVSDSALVTLLFRARKSLVEELASHLTCDEAQFAVSRAADGRVGRKERRRLREHMAECPDCTRFAQVQPRHRRAFRGLALVPIPLSDWVLRAVDTPNAAAATLPVAAAGAATAGSGGIAGVLGGGVAVKAAAVVTAASVAGGVGVVGAAQIEPKKERKTPARADAPGERLGQVAPRGVNVPGRGVAVGKTPERPGRRVGITGSPGRASDAPANGRRPQSPPVSTGHRGSAVGVEARKAAASAGRPVAPGAKARDERPTSNARGASQRAAAALKAERARLRAALKREKLPRRGGPRF
ncbi:MAG: sigma-70 family RNA polymerase sigma factor [Gaiellaceae bacterium]